MNKAIVWVVIAILVIGGAYLLFSRKTKPADDQTAGTSTSVTTAPKDTTAKTATGPQSLTDLLGLGTSQKCSFKDASASGNFYIGSGKARGDFDTIVDGKSTKTHMIIDNQTSYIWVDGQAQGFKMSSQASQQSNTTASQSQGVDTNKKMDYSCQAWSADNSMFTMPSGIQFMDLSSLQPKQ